MEIHSLYQKSVTIRNNEELQKDVQNAIKWERLLHAAEIGVSAKEVVISLTGVDYYYALVD